MWPKFAIWSANFSAGVKRPGRRGSAMSLEVENQPMIATPTAHSAKPEQERATAAARPAASPCLSILLPVRNEGVNIRIMLKVLHAVVDVPHEVLVVYDDPADETCTVVAGNAAGTPGIRPVLNTLGRGVINAIRAGVAVAEGRVRPDFRRRRSWAGARDRGHALAHRRRLRIRELHAVLLRRAATGRLNHRRRRSRSRQQNLPRDFRLRPDRCDNRHQDVPPRSFARLHLEARPIGWAVAFEMSIKCSGGNDARRGADHLNRSPLRRKIHVPSWSVGI